MIAPIATTLITIDVHLPDPRLPQIRIKDFPDDHFMTFSFERVNFYLHDRAALMRIRDQINTYLDESVLAEAIQEVSDELASR